MNAYYQDDYVTLYHGDCLEVADWLGADVLVTDPPYGIRAAQNKMHHSLKPLADVVQNDKSLEARDSALELWGERPAIVFGSWKVARPKNTKHRLIWHKKANLPGMRPQPWYSAEEEIYILGKGFAGKPEQNVLVTTDRRDGAYGEVARLGHPTPKPVGLMERLIAKCPEGVIADPFAGSGATLLAARNLGRKAIGVELEEKYCELMAQRLSQQTFPFELV